MPKSLEMSFSSVRDDSTTVQPVQAEDSSLYPRLSGLDHPVQETDTLGLTDLNVTDLKTPVEDAAGVHPQEEEMGMLNKQ